MCSSRKFLSATTLLILLVIAKALSAEDIPDESLEAARSVGDTRSAAQIRKDNALIEAASRGNIPALKKALKEGAGVNARYIDLHAFLSAGYTDYTALMLATSEGHAEAVRELIAAKADLDLERKGRSSLYFAVFRNRTEIEELLKKAGAKGDPEKMRLNLTLIDAACRGFELKPGAGYPPFPGAPRESQAPLTIEEAVAKGAYINGADPDGCTPLMFAANLCLVDNVATLLKLGADPNRTNKNGDSALSLVENEDSGFDSQSRKKVIELLKAAAARKP